MRCGAVKLAGVAALMVSVTASVAALANAPASAPVRLTPAQSLYMEGCGGCHGIQGSSSRKDVPELRDLVGRYLCTREGREYLIRLPNVAFANMDDRMLAAVMNFVVFDLGGDSAPPGAAPYSAAEVAALRRRPLTNRPVARLGAVILWDAVDRCGRLNSAGNADATF